MKVLDYRYSQVPTFHVRAVLPKRILKIRKEKKVRDKKSGKYIYNKTRT
jgi:hypothetical protein